ncbi:MAG: hypothetical protein AAGB93_07810 [Planctomycetota bacterium]
MILASGLVAAALAPIASGASAHPNSFSISEVHVRGPRIELHLRCQVLSLGEVIEGLDPDLDGHAEEGAIEAHAGAIADYLEAHYRFVPDPGASPGSDPVAESAAGPDVSDPASALARTDALVVEAPLALDPMNEVSEWIDVKLRYRAEGDAFERLGVHVDLFEDTSPGHRDAAAVVWNGVELGAWEFSFGANAHVFVATDETLERGRPALVRYAEAAPAAAARSWDGLLLLVLLLAAAGSSNRSALATTALFACAVAVGIGAAPEVELKPRQVRFLDLTVPLAAAYVALDDLLHREGRTRFVEPIVFGIVLGAREACALVPELAREETSGPALAGFSLGYVGSIAAVTVLALLALRDRRAPTLDGDDVDAGGFAPRRIRVALAAAGLVTGAALFGVRAFGLV